MEIGLSSASFYPTINPEESIKLIKSIGFNSGEIFFNTYSEYEEEFGRILLKEKEKYDFNINSIHSFASAFEPYIFDRYERRREDMVKIFRKVCRVGKIIGAKYYTFHGDRYRPIDTVDLELIIKVYKTLVEIAYDEGIILCQENVSRCMSKDLDFLKILLKEVPELNYTLDIKQAFKCGIDPKEYIGVLKNRIKNLHINDRNQKEDCLLPGKGDVDYRGIIKELKTYGYNGIGIIEVYRDNFEENHDLYKSKKFLEEILREIE